MLHNGNSAISRLYSKCYLISRSITANSGGSRGGAVEPPKLKIPAPVFDVG